MNFWAVVEGDLATFWAMTKRHQINLRASFNKLFNSIAQFHHVDVSFRLFDFDFRHEFQNIENQYTFNC